MPVKNGFILDIFEEKLSSFQGCGDNALFYHTHSFAF